MDKCVVPGETFLPELVEILSSGGHVSLVVSGSSMKPFLKHGRDVVCLRACTDKDIKRGQILLYKRADHSIILHRVRKVLPDRQIIMNGDAQAWCETISFSQVIAVVISAERNGRYISCDHLFFHLWNAFWYPTRALRPVLFKIWHILFCRGAEQRGSSC